jgi:hypothetical protein
MSLGWITAGGLLGLMGLLFWLRVRAGPPAPGTPFRIDYDETSIGVTDNFGERHVVRWDDLEKVAIRIADDGPAGADVFWGLQTQSSDHVLVFPEGATYEAELISEMTRRLPGFNNDEVMHAMGSTSNGLFVVWQKESGPGLPAADDGDA